MGELPTGYIGYPEDPDYEMAFMREKAERERDHARAGLREIQELHKPMVTQVVTGDCAVGECDHEDDCPTVHFEYCAACNEIAEHANAYYAEEGMQIVSHPCPTRQLADKALGEAS